MGIKSLLKKLLLYVMPYGMIVFWRWYCGNLHFKSRKVFKNYYASGQTGHYVHKKTYYNDSPKKIIYMADGRIIAGGLTDRLRGMVSSYKLSRDLNVGFGINFTSPARLTHYLMPNRHDWTIKENEIVYNADKSVICELWSNEQEKDVITMLEKLLGRYDQIHITTNMTTADTEYGSLFDFLFKPAPELQKAVDENLVRIGGGGVYIGNLQISGFAWRL